MTHIERARALYLRADRTGHIADHYSRVGPWFARASGISRTTVGRWGDDDWPRYAVALIELLERLPFEQWPEDWQATKISRKRQ